MQTWRLDDPGQTMVLAALGDRLPQVVYWGERLPDQEDLTLVAQAHALDVTGGMLDANPDLSICPEASQTFPGQPGLRLSDISGAPLDPRFRFLDAQASEGHLALTYADGDLGLTYRAEFQIDPVTTLIIAKSQIEAAKPIRVDWLAAPVMPAPQSSEEMIDFAGRWVEEFQAQHIPWSAGLRLRENRTGRTGHEHFPALILPCRGATNTQGQAYALHYGWSGGHRMVAEELPDGRRQVQFGHTSGTETTPGTQFASAPLYMTFSNRGLNGCAIAFQRHVRDRIVALPDPDRPRPVHYNCWEAVYFDHDLDTLKDIATRAAALGAERFVLDDGWFGRRDDDTSSLGDWTLDPRKYPNGLTPLIDHIEAQGMRFGLWFEPEMVNTDSDLFRAHPAWVLGDDDQIEGRQQRVLNMALPQVRTYLFDRIAALLSAYPIDYIKWDHNRVLPQPDAAQARGTYALLDELRAAFPAVEFESCSSGGGRIDFGVLSRTHRVWLSDSNDALERLRIQHNAALFLPSTVTGSHVGPRTCHTSGRIHDIRFRAWVAASRHMGFEMDPRELTEDETAVLREVTQWYKTNRDWMHAGDIHRLDSDDPAVAAEQQISRDGSKFVAFIGSLDTSAQILPRPVRLTGLDRDARYSLRLLNRDDAPALSRGTPLLKTQDLIASGGWLMSHGIVLPWDFPNRLWVVEGDRL